MLKLRSLEFLHFVFMIHFKEDNRVVLYYLAVAAFFFQLFVLLAA